MSAPAVNRLGMTGFIQSPAGYVHFVYALITDVAVACVPHPVPSEAAALIIWPHRSRPQEQVPVNACRHRTVRRMAERAAPFITEAARHVELANVFLPEQFNSAPLMRQAPPLRSYL